MRCNTLYVVVSLIIKFRHLNWVIHHDFADTLIALCWEKEGKSMNVYACVFVCIKQESENSRRKKKILCTYFPHMSISMCIVDASHISRTKFSPYRNIVNRNIVNIHTEREKCVCDPKWSTVESCQWKSVFFYDVDHQIL